MKRVIALVTAMLLCISLLAACNQTQVPATTQAPTTAPTTGNNQPPENNPDEKEEDDGVLKILMIGHSLGLDSAYLLPEVAKLNGMTELVVGILYHSGCRLGQHVSYLKSNAKEYAYFEFDLSKDTVWRRAVADGSFLTYETGAANDTLISNGTIGQTMQFGIQQQDWDVVVTQAGVFEAANALDSSYPINLNQDIKTILDYVKENDINKKTTPKIAWNLFWTVPDDDSLLNDSYKSNLYGNFPNAHAMYEAMTKVLKETIAPAQNFDYIFPAGTAIENALSSPLVARNLYRDFTHANDYGRLIAAYTWYCVLTGKDIRECQFGPINSKLAIEAANKNAGTHFAMNKSQKDILIIAVEDAIKTPYAMTLFHTN